MRRSLLVVLVLLATALTACGGGDEEGAAGDGEQRTVLVDFRHDEFASAFLSYYPEKVQIHPGDRIDFRQAWTGEPHSVTLGKFVDDFIELFPQFEEYDTVQEARDAGVDPVAVERVSEAYSKLSVMTDQFVTVPAGAEPCFVEDPGDAPVMRDVDTDAIDRDATCPTKGDPQPAFNGRQALYNSGFIPYSGERGNSFTMPIADDADPGTYRYFCNYHFIFMSGEIEVVEPDTTIPSQADVSRQARKEIDEDAADALAKAEEARKLTVGKTITDTSFDSPAGPEEYHVTLPVSGRSSGESPVIINEFFPKNFEARVGEKVTWTLDGSLHTVSFNVPKYFPIFTVDDDTGTVEWDRKAWSTVGWDLDFEPRGFGPDVEGAGPAELDAGRWDGKGGFHSSGALLPGDSFSVTFTKAGTYSFACVLHPQMVGTLQVKS